MSSIGSVETVKTVGADREWSLWRRQIGAILRLEVKKNFWGKRALLLYLLAAIPVFMMFMVAIVAPHASDDIRMRWTGALEVFGYIYEALILRTMVFFGCAWIFMNLFRRSSTRVCTTTSSVRCVVKCWWPGSMPPVWSPRSSSSP
jgi:hypothetical protein